MSCPQVAGLALRAYRARVRQAGLLLHRQRVHVAAHEQRRTVAVAHDGDDAVARRARFEVLADRIRHLVTELFEPRRDQRGAVLLLHRQLRRGVELFVRRQQRRNLAIDHLIEVLGNGRRRDEKKDDCDSLHAGIMRR